MIEVKVKKNKAAIIFTEWKLDILSIVMSKDFVIACD